jgi:hypothetical protein
MLSCDVGTVAKKEGESQIAFLGCLLGNACTGGGQWQGAVEGAGEKVAGGRGDHPRGEEK